MASRMQVSYDELDVRRLFCDPKPTDSARMRRKSELAIRVIHHHDAKCFLMAARRIAKSREDENH